MTTTCGPEGTEFQLLPNGCYSEPELTMYRQTTKRTAKLGKNTVCKVKILYCV